MFSAFHSDKEKKNARKHFTVHEYRTFSVLKTPDVHTRTVNRISVMSSTVYELLTKKKEYRILSRDKPKREVANRK